MILIILILGLVIVGLKTKTDYDNSAMAKFGVMTDMHYYPQELVNPHSNSYAQYLKQDAKLTLESEAVIQKAIEQMIERQLDFVIIAGDVSNEGEKLSHQKLATMLKQLTLNNIPVFITPGNHDINNNLAVNLLFDKPQPIDTITPQEFKEIYNDYGFKQAYSHDKHTLSYCAQITPRLHIITLDANQYLFHKDRPIPDGILPAQTIDWAETLIRQASQKGIRMIGVMHHGLVEHFFDQGRTFSPFLVKDFELIGKRLALAGLDFVFTGHLHAQDVSSASFEGVVIYDIETAALTSAPFAWRQLQLKKDELDINTVYIDDIDFDYGSELPFRKWAMKRVWNGLLELESYFLKHHNGLTEEQTKLVAPYYARAFMAHFCGDEAPSEEDIQFYEKHKSSPSSPFYKVANIFKALWTDTSTSDINLSIPLRHLPKS